jgi:hypothetical protein
MHGSSFMWSMDEIHAQGSTADGFHEPVAISSKGAFYADFEMVPLLAVHRLSVDAQCGSGGPIIPTR